MKIRNIRKLYKTCHTPQNVVQHMRAVAKLAVAIAKKILTNGNQVHLELIRDLALLHDLMKALSFKNYKNLPRKTAKDDTAYYLAMKKKFPHAHDTEITAHLLKQCGEPRLAESIVSQQFDAVISKSHPLRSLEERIVYYADKRICHTEKVPLRQRLDEGYSRYAPGKKPTQKIKKIEKKIFDLEKELSRLAGINIARI
jgi:putative nucleotidyltransferase with HDIG domain